MPARRKSSPPPANPNKTEAAVIEGTKISNGDYIKVRPSAPGKKDGFIGVIRGFWMKDGAVNAIDVYGGKLGLERVHSLRLERVEVLSTRKQNSLKKTKHERAAARAEKLEQARERREAKRGSKIG